MSKITFEENEYFVMAMFMADSRKESISRIKEVIPFIDKDDAELVELVRGTVEKMEHITNAEYAAIDLEPYQQDWEEVEEDEA